MTTQRNGTNAPTGKDRPTTLVSRGRERTARSSLPARTPSGGTSLLTARKREHLPRGHRARAHDARHVVQFAHDYREVARGERQRPLVDGAAHLGQKRVTYAGNPTTYHDHRRVDHVDGRGQRLADQPPGLADDCEGAVVTTSGGLPDNLHGKLAFLPQEGHEERGLTFPRAPFGLQHDRRGSCQRLEATGVAAGAEWTVGIHADVAEIPGT